MKVYVLDVVYMHDEDCFTEDECMMADAVWLHRDVFRACTSKLFWMQYYYKYLQKLIGKFVNMEVYEYEVETSYDSKDDDPPSDIVSSIASTMFWKDAENGHMTANISPLIAYDFGDKDKQEKFIIPEVINDIYTDTDLAYTMPEIDAIEMIALLFTDMDKYIIGLRENPDLIKLKQTLMMITPALLNDFYDVTARFSLDIVYIEKLWYDSLGFLSK